MSRKGIWLVAALACALAAPVQTITATSNGTVGSTSTSLVLCADGPGVVSYPGATAPSGCLGDSTVTLCPGNNVHAFVKSQLMVDGKRPTLQPLAGVVAVHLSGPTYGSTLNVSTSATDGSALLEIGNVPPGTYEAKASLWTGERTAADGSLMSYPASSTTMTLVVPEAPCTAPTSASVGGKNGCGAGDANHVHNPKSGKTCPTK